jgi:hypothetical protein
MDDESSESERITDAFAKTIMIDGKECRVILEQDFDAMERAIRIHAIRTYQERRTFYPLIG